MSICIFEQSIDGRCVCTECGRPDPIGKSACHKIGGRRCLAPPKPPATVPPFHHRLWSFTKAWANHLLHGMPATPEHMRAQRLAICKGCEFYEKAGCLKCGCPITDKKKWLDDKLSMAGQRCPVNKWGPVELAPSLGFRAALNALGRKITG
jgi:hypothetical protein